MARKKFKVGEDILVAVDPRVNNGVDEAPGKVTKVNEVEDGNDTVNAVYFLDTGEVQRLDNLQVSSKRPKDDDEDAERTASGLHRVAYSSRD